MAAAEKIPSHHLHIHIPTAHGSYPNAYGNDDQDLQEEEGRDRGRSNVSSESAVSMVRSWPVTFTEGMEANLTPRSTSPNMLNKHGNGLRARVLKSHHPESNFLEPLECTRLLPVQAQGTATQVADPLGGAGREAGVVGEEYGNPRENDNNQSTFAQATFNAVNLLLGVGVLALPFALRSGGYLFALPMLFLMALITNYTGKLLGRCLQYRRGMRTYPDIGEAAFGRSGRIVISILFFTELFTACAMFIVLVGDNLAKIFPSRKETDLMLLGFVVILPTTWTPHLRMLSYFSIIGIVSSVFLVVTLIYIGAVNPMEKGSYLHPQPTEWLSEKDRLPMAIGLTMVGFAGHAVFPSIHTSMKTPGSYDKMLNVTYVLILFVYVVIEVLGYRMYGLATQKEITLNLMDSNKGWITTSVTWMIALNPASKYALTLNPVALSVEELFFSEESLAHPSRGTSFLRAIIRTLLALASLLCAMYMPHFARITSLLGALFSMIVSAIFPCACYLKLYRTTLSLATIRLNELIILGCTALAIVGTLASFLSPA